MSMLDISRTTDAAGRGSDFAHLSRLIKSAGLMDRRRGYYLYKIAATSTLALLAAVVFVLLGDSWWQLAVAAFLAVISTQIGFLGHDAGHRQMFASHQANFLAGIAFATVGVGMSYAWWVDKHVRHHAHPNDDDRDPDVQAGAFVFTTGQAGAAGAVGRVFYRYQAYTFFPLLLLEAVNLRVASIRYLLRAGNVHRGREAWLMGAHIVGYFAAVFIVMSPLHALAFIAVHQGLFGLYLGCSFAPNHKGMPPLSAEDDADFLRRQVLTSRNIRGHWLTDLTLGGLNYQIEHHLFPSMPRRNLRHAQPIVEAFCNAVGVPYRKTSAVASYAQALRHLDTIGRATRATPVENAS
jgi:fatty acid desaturase